MHADLEVRRRVLAITYRRYLTADRAWSEALREVRAWFPRGSGPNRAPIGDPGSPVRRLYERRERALLQLQAARQQLESAKRRLRGRDGGGAGARILLLDLTR